MSESDIWSGVASGRIVNLRTEILVLTSSKSQNTLIADNFVIETMVPCMSVYLLFSTDKVTGQADAGYHVVARTKHGLFIEKEGLSLLLLAWNDTSIY